MAKHCLFLLMASSADLFTAFCVKLLPSQAFMAPVAYKALRMERFAIILHGFRVILNWLDTYSA